MAKYLNIKTIIKIVLLICIFACLIFSLVFLTNYRSETDYENETQNYRNEIIHKAEALSLALQNAQDKTQTEKAISEYDQAVANYKVALSTIQKPTFKSDLKQKNQEFVTIAESLVPKAQAYLQTFENNALDPEIAIGEYNKVLEELDQKTTEIHMKS